MVSHWFPGRQVLELAVIALLGLLYFSLFPVKNVDNSRGGLQLHLLEADVRLNGLEHERLSGVLLPIEIGLRRYRHIPAWNPYLGIGEPTINNPFNYLFNPFASLPVLLFGGLQGTKLAIILALLIAGYNMWALARMIGIGAVGRVTGGALYMMSGGIAGKFHIGHFQLGLSLAWMPLVFAGLWWTLHSTDRRAPVLMAVAFALLFFAGNIYYTLHTLISMVVMVAFHLFGDGHLKTERLRRVAVAGMFAFGLTALQFMPVWAVRDYIGGHPGDPHLASRYDLGQALANFIFPWPNWSIFEDPNYKLLTGVDYAYIGPAAFLLIAGATALLLARPDLQRNVRGPMAWIAFILALVMIVWGAGQTPVLQYLYANIPRLAEFRFVGRAHAVAALWLLVLAGMSVDSLWKATREISAFENRGQLVRAMLTGGLVWLLFLAYSVQNDAGRAAMVLYDYRLKETLDASHFMSFNDAAQGLFLFIFAAVVGDTLLLVLHSTLRPTQFGQYGSRFSIYGARLLQLVVLGVVLLALADVMQVNSRLYVFNRRIADFSELYPYVRESDTTTPFPAINEPLAPFAFSAYEMEIRNWGLDEGWMPTTPPSIIPFEEGSLRDLPRWAVVWNEPGARALAERYVEENEYEMRLCTSTEIAGYRSEQCNRDAPDIAILYELPDALPYAFVAEAERLTTQPETIRQGTVSAAEVVSHQQDTVTIQAAMPAGDSNEYYLIVQETHFPGWRAFADNIPVETVSVGRFVGIPMLPGEHTYTLRFEPLGFATGLVIFLATLVAIGFYLRRGDS